MKREPLVKFNTFDKACIIVTAVCIAISLLLSVSNDRLPSTILQIIATIGVITLFGNIIRRVTGTPRFAYFGYALLIIGAIIFSISILLAVISIPNFSNAYVEAWLFIGGAAVMLAGVLIVSFAFSIVRRQQGDNIR